MTKQSSHVRFGAQSGLAASEAETRLGLVAVRSIVASCSMAVGLGWIRVEHRVDVVEPLGRR